MATPPTSTHRVAGAARSGVLGTIVAAVAFFDGVFIGAPIALLAASFRPSVVYVLATVVVVFLVIGCCRWVDRRWEDWFAGKNGARIEKRLETMRASRPMAHPVAWIQRGSDRWYALAAAVANPILVGTLARFVGGKPIGKRRIVLEAVAYAFPYVAMWSIVGFVFGETIRTPRAAGTEFEGCARHDSNVRPLPPQGTPPETAPDDARPARPLPSTGFGPSGSASPLRSRG